MVKSGALKRRCPQGLVGSSPTPGTGCQRSARASSTDRLALLAECDWVSVRANGIDPMPQVSGRPLEPLRRQRRRPGTLRDLRRRDGARAAPPRAPDSAIARRAPRSAREACRARARATQRPLTSVAFSRRWRPADAVAFGGSQGYRESPRHRSRSSSLTVLTFERQLRRVRGSIGGRGGCRGVGGSWGYRESPRHRSLAILTHGFDVRTSTARVRRSIGGRGGCRGVWW